MRGLIRAIVVTATAAVTLVVAPAVDAARPPALAWSPVANGGYSFGPVPPGQALSQTFTLTNSGGSSTAMLTEAHIGFLFRAPENVKQQFPQLRAVETYKDLMKLIRGAMA